MLWPKASPLNLCFMFVPGPSFSILAVKNCEEFRLTGHHHNALSCHKSKHQKGMICMDLNFTAYWGTFHEDDHSQKSVNCCAVTILIYQIVYTIFLFKQLITRFSGQFGFWWNIFGGNNDSCGFTVSFSWASKHMEQEMKPCPYRSCVILWWVFWIKFPLKESSFRTYALTAQWF